MRLRGQISFAHSLCSAPEFHDAVDDAKKDDLDPFAVGNPNRKQTVADDDDEETESGEEDSDEDS